MKFAPLALVLLLAGHAVAARPLDVEVQHRARELVADSGATLAFARTNLSLLVLKHRQIRNAISEFEFHSRQVAALSAQMQVDPGVFKKSMRNLEMWGGTVDWHLNDGTPSAVVQKVGARWATTVKVWARLKEAVAASGRTQRFERLHAR